MNAHKILKQTEATAQFKCPECGQFMPYHHDSITDHYVNNHVGTKAPNVNSLEVVVNLAEKHGKMRKESRTANIEAIAPSDILQDEELNQFMTVEQVNRLRQLASMNGAQLYKFRTLEAGVTDKYNIGHGTRTFSNDEKVRSARTMIFKNVNLNHLMYLPEMNSVADCEAIIENGNATIVGVLYIENELVNALYELGIVLGVSVEFYPRQEVCSCNQPINCQCNQVGIRFDGIAVITAPYQPGDADAEMLRVEIMKNIESLLGAYATKYEAVSLDPLKTQVQLSLLEKFASRKTETLSTEKDYPWSQCHADQMAKGYSADEADKICGYIKAQNSSLESDTSNYDKLVAEAIAHLESTGEIRKLQNNSLHDFEVVNHTCASGCECARCKKQATKVNESENTMNAEMQKETNALIESANKPITESIKALSESVATLAKSVESLTAKPKTEDKADGDSKKPNPSDATGYAEMTKKMSEMQAQLEALIKTQNENSENARKQAAKEATGLGSPTGSPAPTREDLAPFANAKLESMSLQDVVETIAAETGTSVDKLVAASRKERTLSSLARN